MRIVGGTEHVHDVSSFPRDLRNQGAGLAATEKEKMHEYLSVNERRAGRSARGTHSGEYFRVRIGEEGFMQALDHRRHLLFVNDEREIDF